MAPTVRILILFTCIYFNQLLSWYAFKKLRNSWNNKNSAKQNEKIGKKISNPPVSSG